MPHPPATPSEGASAPVPPPLPDGLELLPLPDEKPRIQADPATAAPAEPSPAEVRKRQEAEAAAKLREVEAKRQRIVERSQSLKQTPSGTRNDAVPGGNAAGDERVGDLLAQAGRLGAALDAYAKTLAALPSPQLRGPLEAKIAAVRARQRQRWLVRGGLAAAVLIGTGVAVVALRSAMPSHPTPVTTAPAPVLPADFAARITSLIDRAKNANTPWSELEYEARLLLPGALDLKPQVQRVLDQALATHARIDAAIIAIEGAWWSDPAKALQDASRLRRSEPGLAPADLLRLPGAVRLSVRDPDDNPVSVRYDDRDLPARTEHLLCRRVDRPTRLSAQAPGCETWSRVLAADLDASECVVDVRLDEKPLWSTSCDQPQRLRWQGDVLLAAGATRCDAFDRQGRQLTALAVTELGTTTDLLRFDLADGPDGRLLASTALGTWELAANAGGVIRTLWQDGSALVLTCVTRPLVLRTGVPGHFQIERAGLPSDSPVALVAHSGGREIWRTALAAELPAALAAGTDTVAVLDDRALRLFDQEGAVLKTAPLPFVRNAGPLHHLGGDGDGSAVLVPNAQGVVPFVFHAERGFVPGQLCLPLDAGRIATHGDLLAGLGRDGVLALWRWQNGAVAPLWTLSAPAGRHWAGAPVLGDNHVAQADDHGTLHLIALADRSRVRRITLNGSPLLPPAWTADVIAVVDTTGRLNAYPWKR